MNIAGGRICRLQYLGSVPVQDTTPIGNLDDGSTSREEGWLSLDKLRLIHVEARSAHAKGRIVYKKIYTYRPIEIRADDADSRPTGTRNISATHLA